MAVNLPLGFLSPPAQSLEIGVDAITSPSRQDPRRNPIPRSRDLSNSIPVAKKPKSTKSVGLVGDNLHPNCLALTFFFAHKFE